MTVSWLENDQTERWQRGTPGATGPTGPQRDESKKRAPFLGTASDGSVNLEIGPSGTGTRERSGATGTWSDELADFSGSSHIGSMFPHVPV